MVHVIHAWRDVLLFGQWPDIKALFLVLLFSVVMCGLGMYLLRRYDRLYPRLA